MRQRCNLMYLLYLLYKGALFTFMANRPAANYNDYCISDSGMEADNIHV